MQAVAAEARHERVRGSAILAEPIPGLRLTTSSTFQTHKYRDFKARPILPRRWLFEARYDF